MPIVRALFGGGGVAARVDGLVVAQGRGGGTGEGEEKTEAEKGTG